MRKRLSRRACCAIAFERVEAADPPMLEAVKEALVHLDASPGLGSGRSPRCVITAARTTQLAATNKCLAKNNKSGTGREATKKRESRSKALCSGR